MSTSPQPRHHEPGDEFSGRASKRRRTAGCRDAGHQQETGLMRDGGSQGLPRFVGSGSGIHFVRTVYDTLARSTGQPSRGQSQLVPGEDDQLGDDRNSGPGHAHSPGASARATFWRDDELSSGPAGTGLTFEALVAWTRSYFLVWHPAFPFLHGPDVLAIFEKAAEDGMDSLSAPDATTVRALVSISLADARQLHSTLPKHPLPSELVFLSPDHVASCMLFVIGTPASLKNLQAALCVELFLVSMLKFNMASRLGGSIVRMAYHLGLHRCPRRYPNFSPHEVSMRKRIWWSFYCLERLVCQALGLPLDVQDDDVDVCYPTSERHESSAERGEPQEDGTGGHRQLWILTLLSKHAQLRGMILELRHKSLHARQDTIERALEVQSRLGGWANEVHDIATADWPDEEDGVSGRPITTTVHGSISPLYQTLLLILQHESTITLNRPLLAKKPATSASQAALQACIHASRTIIEVLDPHILSHQTVSTDDETAPLQALMAWPLMTWSVWMSCFVLTFAALEGVTSPLSAQRYAKRSLRVLKQLSKRGTAWPGTCSQAVQHLLTALEQRDAAAPNIEEARQQPVVSVPSSGYTRSRLSSIPSLQAPFVDGDRRKSGRNSSVAPMNDTLSGTTPLTWFQSGPPQDTATRRFLVSGPAPEIPQAQQFTSDPGLSGADTLPNAAFMPQSTDFVLSLDDENWLLDPLSALDFSNFAQAGSADSSMGFTFHS